MKTETLAEELLYSENGHASDIALTAIADGEIAIVTANVLAHVEVCPTCGKQLGHVALLSLHAGRELLAAKDAGVIAVESARAEVKRALPWRVIAVGLAVAFVGALPEMSSAIDGAPGKLSLAVKSVPTFVQSLSLLLRGLTEHDGIGIVLTFASALVLIGAATAFARRQSVLANHVVKNEEN